MTQLLSLVLTLKPREAIAAPPHLGRAAHAALLRAVEAADPALAAQLHDDTGPKPFTCSSLMGKRTEGKLDPTGAYTLRYTALTAETAQVLQGAFVAKDEGQRTEGREPKRPEKRGELSETPRKTGRAFHTLQSATLAPALRSSASAGVELDGVLFDVVTRPAELGENPWAASTTFEELSAPWLLARAEPERRITLMFASPTTFHSGGRSVPLPQPELVFGSLLERWNAYAPVALPDETRRFAAECLAVSRYELQTRSMPFKEGSVKIGMVGQVTFAATRYDRYWQSLINLLADFALFAGVGAGVTMGMGQCRRLVEREA